MATSGTVTFKVNRDQLITQALIECGVIDPENTTTPTATAISNAAIALNMMVKAWEAIGLQLWEKRYVSIFLNLNQGVYVFGNPGPSGDHACISTPWGTGFVQTTGSGSGTSITVTTTSTTATPGIPAITIATGWNIGIQQTNGSFFWTTVNGAPAGNVITLTAAPTIGNATNAIVYAYQTKLWRFLRVTDGFVHQTNGSDVPLRVISREEWNRFGYKSSSGSSIQVTYDPQLTNGILEVYPVPSSQSGIMYLEVQKPIDDFASSTDDYDLPQEWAEALKFNLALRLCSGYGVPQQKRKEIKENADLSYGLVNAFDQEAASIYISPNATEMNNATSR